MLKQLTWEDMKRDHKEAYDAFIKDLVESGFFLPSEAEEEMVSAYDAIEMESDGKIEVWDSSAPALTPRYLWDPSLGCWSMVEDG